MPGQPHSGFDLLPGAAQAPGSGAWAGNCGSSVSPTLVTQGSCPFWAPFGLFLGFLEAFS